MAIQIQIRRGTSSEWSTSNPILAQGEVGYELNTGKAKVGDGLTAWNSLGYFNPNNSVTSVAMTTPTGLQVSGSPITTSGTLALTYASGYSIPTTSSQTNWDTAYTDRYKWDGGSSGLNASTGRTSLGLGTAATLNAGSANGVATLDGSGTVPTSQLPAAVLGGVKYQGTWNASTNTPTLASGTGTQGYYYVVSVAGSTNLDGITDWKIGDWAIYNGTAWQKVDNTDSVTSVNGYTGTVVLAASDVGAYPNTNPNGYTSNTGTVTSVAMTTPTGLSVSGSPITTTGTLALSMTAGYSIPTTASQTNWDSAYSERRQWDGGSTNLVASTGRTSLGATTLGSNLFTITDPGAITFPRFNADNTVSALTASSFRTAIGAGTGDGTVTSVGATSPVASSGGATPTISLSSGYGDTQNPYASKTANFFLAAPDGSAGAPTFRAIVAADVPTLNQNTTGTASNVTGTIAIANGGTGQTTQTAAFDALAPTTSKGDLIAHNGTDNVRVSAGTNGYVLTADSSAAAGVAWAASGGGISSADIQEFTSTGTSTWTKPAGAKLVYVLIFAGGSGGGSGRRRATASVAAGAAGGGGGGAGGRTELWIPAISLGSTETVTVGAGGTGGAAQTLDDTTGNAGTIGGNSSFGSWALARTSIEGQGGQITSGSGGTGGAGLGEFVSGLSGYSTSGGSGSAGAGGNGNRGGYRPGGGGAGGGFIAGGTALQFGGNGGLGGSFFSTSTSTTSGGGTFGSGNNPGGNGANATTYFVGGSGGGGGGSGLTTPGAGGNGGYPGGGGGGGGAGHGVNSGKGGDGGNGYVRVVTFF